MSLMMRMAVEKLSASLGWKYPRQSPFQARITAPMLAERNEPVAPPAPSPASRVKRPRKLAWLYGGEERMGFSILGRRVDPQSDSLRSPRVK